ncbi:MAG: hypothetical protein LUF91_09435 [Oscillospiraceae bacterium]|nr:hypothetical protein [Oscillospiraceae bacterium]
MADPITTALKITINSDYRLFEPVFFINEIMIPWLDISKWLVLQCGTSQLLHKVAASMRGHNFENFSVLEIYAIALCKNIVRVQEKHLSIPVDYRRNP